MDGYAEYLETMLELREQEINMYKNFIEKNLKCKIKEEVYSDVKFSDFDPREVFFKVVTIPESRFTVRVSV